MPRPAAPEAHTVTPYSAVPHDVGGFAAPAQKTASHECASIDDAGRVTRSSILGANSTFAGRIGPKPPQRHVPVHGLPLPTWRLQLGSVTTPVHLQAEGHTPQQRLFLEYTRRLLDPAYACTMALRLAQVPPGDMRSMGAAAIGFVAESLAILHTALRQPTPLMADNAVRLAMRTQLWAAIDRLKPFFVTGSYKDGLYLLMLWAAFERQDQSLLNLLVTWLPQRVQTTPTSPAAEPAHTTLVPPLNIPEAALKHSLCTPGRLRLGSRVIGKRAGTDLRLSSVCISARHLTFAIYCLDQIAVKKDTRLLQRWFDVNAVTLHTGETRAQCIELLVNTGWVLGLRRLITYFGDMDLCTFDSRQGPLHIVASAPAAIREPVLLEMSRLLLDAGADPSAGQSTSYEPDTGLPPILLPPLYTALRMGRAKLGQMLLEAQNMQLAPDKAVARHIKRLRAVADGVPLAMQTVMLIMVYLRDPAQRDIVMPLQNLLQAHCEENRRDVQPEDAFLLVQGALLLAHALGQAPCDALRQNRHADPVVMLNRATWALLSDALLRDITRLAAFATCNVGRIRQLALTPSQARGSIFEGLCMGYVDITQSPCEMFAIVMTSAQATAYEAAIQMPGLFRTWQHYGELFATLLRVRNLKAIHIHRDHIGMFLARAKTPEEIAILLRVNAALGDNALQDTILAYAQQHNIAFWAAAPDGDNGFLWPESPIAQVDLTPVIRAIPHSALISIMAQRDASGQTLLHVAARGRFVSLKGLLASLGAEAATHVMHTDFFGRTPLQEALVCGQPRNFGALWRTLSRSDNLDVILSQALFVAVKRGHAHMVDAIESLEGGAAFLARQRPKLMQAALLRGDAVSFKRIVQQFGFDASAFCTAPYHLMHALAEGGSEPCFELVRQHIGTKKLCAALAVPQRNGRLPEDVCRAQKLKAALMRLRGVAPRLISPHASNLDAKLEMLLSDLAAAPSYIAVETGAASFLAIWTKYRTWSGQATHVNPTARQLDLAWQLAHLVAHHTRAGMGYHFDEHLPCMALSQLRRRIDDGQKLGASQFSPSCILALLHLRGLAIQKASTPTRSTCTQTLNLSDPRLSGRGFTRATVGCEPHLFTGSQSVRFVYAFRRDKIVFVSIYPLPSDA